MARTLIIAVAGVAVVGLGITGWRALSSSPPPAPAVAAPVRQIPMVSLLVAYRDVPPGAFLRPGDMSSVSVAADIAPPRAWRDTAAARASLVGALVRRPIPHDTMLDPSELLPAGDHGFLAALLTPGMRAFTIPHDQIISGSELIWPGDRIDLILTQQMPAGLAPGHQISAETVLTNLRVLAIDRQLIQPLPTDDEKEATRSDSNSGTVTVEVSPSDAEKLAVALRLGRVAFAVRAALGPEARAELATDAPPGHPTGATWADTVMHSLDQVPPSPPAVSLHVFEGAGMQEYKF